MSITFSPTSESHPTATPVYVNPFPDPSPADFGFTFDPDVIIWGEWGLSREDYAYAIARPNKTRCFICRGFNCHHSLCNELRASWAIREALGQTTRRPLTLKGNPMRFSKRIFQVGEIEAESGTLTITPSRLKRIDAEFNRYKAAGNATLCHLGHPTKKEYESGRSARQVVGKVIRFAVAPDGKAIDAIVDIRNAAAAKLASDNLIAASVILAGKMEDGKGNVFRDLPICLDLVSDPAVKDQGPFIRLLDTPKKKKHSPVSPSPSRKVRKMTLHDNENVKQAPTATAPEGAVAELKELRRIVQMIDDGRGLESFDRAIEIRYPGQVEAITGKVENEDTDAMTTTSPDFAAMSLLGVPLTPDEVHMDALRKYERNEAKEYVDGMAKRHPELAR